MPRVRPIPERSPAESTLMVAESRSLEALGVACCRAIGQFTGSPTVGLYWLSGEIPQVFFRANVPDGLLDDYRTGFGRYDPFVDSVLSHGRVVDGLSLIGPNHWAHSSSYDLLRTWGFCYNMCGPLRVDDKIVGVFYTGAPDWDAPYSAEDRYGMELICRAGSVALANLIMAGIVDARAGPQPRDGSLPVPYVTTTSHDRLPPRAAEVARLVCRGRSNKQIARDMGISDQTVKEHVGGLCRRFGALNRTELAARLQSGMVRQ